MAHDLELAESDPIVKQICKLMEHLRDQVLIIRDKSFRLSATVRSGGTAHQSVSFTEHADQLMTMRDVLAGLLRDVI